MSENKKFIWMEVDLKNNEEPIHIANTAGQLAIKCKVKSETIYQAISRAKNKGWRCKYVRVEDDE